MAEPAALSAVELESEAASPAPPGPPAEQLLVEDDLLIEEVSIDGMCGVY